MSPSLAVVQKKSIVCLAREGLPRLFAIAGRLEGGENVSGELDKMERLGKSERKEPSHLIACPTHSKSFPGEDHRSI